MGIGEFSMGVDIYVLDFRVRELERKLEKVIGESKPKFKGFGWVGILDGKPDINLNSDGELPCYTGIYQTKKAAQECYEEVAKITITIE